MIAALISIIIGSSLLLIHRTDRLATTSYPIRNAGIVLLTGGVVYGALTLLG